jgi:hypothetical protein
MVNQLESLWPNNTDLNKEIVLASTDFCSFILLLLKRIGINPVQSTSVVERYLKTIHFENYDSVYLVYPNTNEKDRLEIWIGEKEQTTHYLYRKGNAVSVIRISCDHLIRFCISLVNNCIGSNKRIHCYDPLIRKICLDLLSELTINPEAREVVIIKERI